MIDPVEFGKAMGALVKEATGPLLARIDQLEKQLADLPAPEKLDLEALAKSAAALIEKPQDGVSVTADDVAPMLQELVAKAVREIQVPEPEKIDLDALAKSAAAIIEKPKDGEPGKDVDMEVVKEHIEAMFKALPTPQNGKDADMAEVKSHLAELVKSIEPVKPMPAPTVEEVAATFERRFSDLALSWERQARDTFEKAADRMPKPKDGRDAIALDGFDLTLAEDGRTVTAKMQAGETIIEKSVKIAAVIDKGTYKQEGQYEKGDGVTYGGCYWIATSDAPEGVPGVSKDFRLAVKKGRDGKDLRDNASKVDPSKGVKLK